MRRAALLLAVAACVAVAPTAASARTTGPHGAKAGRGDAVGKPGARARGVVVRRRAARRPAKRPAAGRWATLPVVGAVDAVTGAAAGTPGAAPPSSVPGPAVTPTPTPDPGYVPDLPGNAERSVAVLSDEWSFTLSQPSVRAGSVRVEFDNSRAEDAHELATRGADLTFGHTAAGRIVAKTFTLSPGTYTLFCPLPQHEALGMRATLTVTR